VSNWRIDFEELLVSKGNNQGNCNQAISHILDRLQNELKKDLFYHSFNHTVEVMIACREILAHEPEVSNEDANLLLVAAAYHDCGFLTTYRNHEESGCEIARKDLLNFGFEEENIKIIERLIMSTKLPQSASNKLEQIICDADLDYLGGERYEEISFLLRKEFLAYEVIDESVNWIDFQLDFFDNHHYWTEFSKKFRKPNKDAVVEHLKELSLKNKI